MQACATRRVVGLQQLFLTVESRILFAIRIADHSAVWVPGRTFDNDAEGAAALLCTGSIRRALRLAIYASWYPAMAGQALI
jgi:hypothetical protein